MIVGSLGQLTGSGGGPMRDKVRSFELFRRSLHEPEVITFDELVARAEWHVEAASHQVDADESEESHATDPWSGRPDPWEPDEPPF